MRRRREPANHGDRSGGHDGGGALRWLLTYADMITLLMAFFIMLYSMSILNLNKFREVAISIRSGFNGLTQGQGQSILGTNGQFSIKPSPLLGDSVGVPWKAIKDLEQMVRDADLEQSVKLRVDDRGLVVSLMTDKAIFPKGRAEIVAETREVLDMVDDLIGDVPNQVQIEGHTCDLPISSAQFPSNWELSTARATNVVRYMIEEAGIPPERLSAAGYASSKPLVPNDSEKNRALNRRVDIVIFRPDYR